MLWAHSGNLHFWLFKVSKLRQPKQLLFSIPISELFKLKLQISIFEQVSFSFNFFSLEEISIPIEAPFKIEIDSKEKRFAIFPRKEKNYQVLNKN